jgi:hypothetical protein
MPGAWAAERGHGFAGNPYLFLGRRPFREARLRSHILHQHRAGRPLADILDDPYVRRCGSESFCWQVVQDARTLESLERDVARRSEATRRERAPRSPLAQAAMRARRRSRT